MGLICSSDKQVKVKVFSPYEIQCILYKLNSPYTVDELSIQFKNSIQNLFYTLQQNMKDVKQKLLFETERRTALFSIFKLICLLMQNYYAKFKEQQLNISNPKMDLCVAKILIESYLAMKTLSTKEEIWWSSNYFQLRYRALQFEYKISINHLKPSIEGPFIEHITQLIEIIEFLLSQQRCDIEKKTTLQIAESHIETNHFYNELKNNMDFKL